MARGAWVILGCGYTGERVAARLVDQGTRVIAATRDAARASELATRPGIEVRLADPTVPGSLAGWFPERAVVVDSVPPDPAHGPHAAAVVRAAAAARSPRIVYLSSTGVYGQGSGEWVDEDSPTQEWDAPRARDRLLAERTLLASAKAAGIEAVVLRVAAIYGPGRGVHERLLAGEPVAVDDRWVSRIHVDDLVSAIIAAGEATPLVRPIYVIADDEPTTSRAIAHGVAALLGIPPGVDSRRAEARAANRRVRNTRMKEELRVSLRYPTWREGVTAAVRAGRRSHAPPRLAFP